MGGPRRRGSLAQDSPGAAGPGHLPFLRRPGGAIALLVRRIHGTGGEAASSQFSPDIVQEHATTTYRQAFHDERKLLRRLATPYNDTLYDSVQPEAKSGSRPRRHR